MVRVRAAAGADSPDMSRYRQLLSSGESSPMFAVTPPAATGAGGINSPGAYGRGSGLGGPGSIRSWRNVFRDPTPRAPPRSTTELCQRPERAF
ncbi:hypothetical protein SBA4_1720020 [Candidatus Sulfopaludibacter sp. SbA4]|nr:hypothetical protein SBA4_1720020 [Candidatus Sulfopaludibacter sp. SbA4]